MLLYLTLLLPLVGGAVLPLFRFRSGLARGLYVEAVTLATSCLAFYLLICGDADTYTLFEVIQGQPLAFRTDGLGSVFVGLIAVLWPLASLYAFEYMEHEERPNAFFAWYTMSYSVTLAIALSANLVTMYIFYECLTLVTLPLVTHKEDDRSKRAGMTYLLYSITGAALGLIALCFVLQYAETTAFVPGGVLKGLAPAAADTMRWVFVLAFLGFGVKAAVFPLCAWLPAVSVAPTPVTALLHAVAVVNAGAFAVLRAVYDIFGTNLLFGSGAQTVALALSCATVVFASVMAVRERHLKRRLAWSTVSNLSYMLMGASLMSQAGMVGAMCHLLFHGLMKIVLFDCAGAVMVQTGSEYVEELRGYGRVMPFTMGVFTLASAALVGTPPMVGFISKWHLLTAAAETGLPMGRVSVAALIVSTVLTAVYLLTVVFTAYFRPLNENAAELAGKRLDPSWRMCVPLAVIAALIVGLGVYGGPLVSYLRSVASVV